MIYIANNLILDNGECNYSIVREVIELYLEHNVWYLPTSIDKSSTTNVADIQKNVVQICLMTEGLARLILSLHVTKQSLCLIHCLYPLLERVGSEIGLISLSGTILLYIIYILLHFYVSLLYIIGQIAIILLAQSGGYNDPVDLVVKNTDYLSHHFTTKLWSLSQYPEVLNALKVVMNLNGSNDLLKSFHTIVTNVNKNKKIFK